MFLVYLPGTCPGAWYPVDTCKCSRVRQLYRVTVSELPSKNTITKFYSRASVLLYGRKQHNTVEIFFLILKSNYKKCYLEKDVAKGINPICGVQKEMIQMNLLAKQERDSQT